MSTAAPAIKTYRSRKPQAVKTAVLAKRVNGANKAQICRDLGIAKNTVNRILDESDIDAQLESGTAQACRLIPKAIKVVDDRLSKGSENAAFRLLEGVGVLGEKRNMKKSNDPSLQIAIQNLIMPHTSNSGSSQSPSTETPAIEVKSIESSDT